MIDSIYLAQLVGAIAFLISFIGLAQSDDKKFLNLYMFSTVLFILQFGILSQINTMISYAVVFAMIVVARDRFKNYYFLCGFITLSMLQLSFYVDDIYDVFSVSAAFLNIYAVFCFRGIRMRLLLILSSACMCINGFLIGSWNILANDFLSIVLMLYSINKINSFYSKNSL